ncbi:MAG: hypothetical protein ACTSPB_11930 [Candidatus Thorarchaeota archaeon]
MNVDMCADCIYVFKEEDDYDYNYAIRFFSDGVYVTVYLKKELFEILNWTLTNQLKREEE